MRTFTTPSKLEFDEGLIGDLRRATNVERAHGELRTRFADRLRGDDTDGLAHVDRRPARQVAAVTFAANPILSFAGQDRTDLHFLDSGRIDAVDMPFLKSSRRF